MNFDNNKRNVLNKLRSHDKSNIGTVDRQIKSTIDIINRKNDFYTTSSCAGRIVVLDLGKTGKKNEAKFVLRAHKPITKKELEKGISHGRNLWFRQEPAIIHVVARTIEKGAVLLDLARKAGFKHSGVQTIKRRITIEIRGSEFINLPIYSGIGEAYQTIIIKKANESLKKARKNLATFTKKLVTELS